MRSWLVCGVAGTRLAEDERGLLEELRPGGVILFARNVGARAELIDLVAALAALPSRPYVSIDLEGGKVNRLSRLIGPLPTAAAAARAGEQALRALGTALGAACAHFGIGVDYAPVLDLACGGGWLADEKRCFGARPGEVELAARTVLEALESYGVAGCLKHYPGLGSGTVDSHRDLPLLDDRVAEEREVFHRLCRPERAVMVAHALAPSLGDGMRPASLSGEVIRPLRGWPCGPIIGDDLEMGALEAFGTMGERAAAALLAGCDQVLVCNALGERAQVAAHVEAWAARDARLAAALESAAARVGAWGRGALRPASWDEVEAAAAAAREAAPA